MASNRDLLAGDPRRGGHRLDAAVRGRPDPRGRTACRERGRRCRRRNSATTTTGCRIRPGPATRRSPARSGAAGPTSSSPATTTTGSSPGCSTRPTIAPSGSPASTPSPTPATAGSSPVLLDEARPWNVRYLVRWLPNPTHFARRLDADRPGRGVARGARGANSALPDAFPKPPLFHHVILGEGRPLVSTTLLLDSSPAGEPASNRLTASGWGTTSHVRSGGGSTRAWVPAITESRGSSRQLPSVPAAPPPLVPGLTRRAQHAVGRPAGHRMRVRPTAGPPRS